MSSKDLDRAAYIKRLYDKQLDKADAKLSLKERMKHAEDAMDKKLGKEWRSEIAKPEVEMVEIIVETPAPKMKSKEEHDSFYERVHAEGDKEGLGPKDSEAPEEHELSEADDAKCIKELLHEILEKLND
jgi:hypothetical protein